MSADGAAPMPTGYIRAVLGPRDPVLESVLRHSLRDERMPVIQIDDNAGRVLQLLTLLGRPTAALEIGTLFGYSAIYLARGLPPGARLTTLEVDPRAAAVARHNIAAAGFADVVDVVEADAVEFLRRPGAGPYDLIFIDGEKKAYPDYLKVCFPVLRKGGLLIADDAFALGDFSAETGEDDPGASAAGITAYNRAVARAGTLHSAFVGTETGLMVSVKG
jgi:predicted O-methyltransferase YrrM